MTKGQELVDKLESWFSSFMYFPDPSYALICAMWAINTWVFQVFDAVPYLAITGATKRVGKSTLLDALSLVCKGAEKAGAGTDATVYRLMEQYDGWCSLFFDEAERMASGKVGLMRTLMNFGYRKGETVPRTMPGGQVHKFPCFGPKCFALIGDLTDTLRDRCLLLVLERGTPARKPGRSLLESEAEGIKVDILRYLDSGALRSLPVIAPDWLEDREQEIWTPIISLAHAMKLDRKTIERLERASADLAARKGQPIRRIEDGDAEQKAEDARYAERLIRDMAKVVKDGEKAVSSAVMIERLRGIPTAPWRSFRGVGLNEITLANLVSRFNGVKPGLYRFAKPGTSGKGREGTTPMRGYSVQSIRASVPREEE